MQLSVLIAVTVAAFLATRVFAQHLEDQRRLDAARWFARGQEAMSLDRFEEAIGDFRGAVLTRPGEKTYVLRLAEALLRGKQAPAAERALLTLRESSPDDADVNLALARVYDTEGDRAEASRFYRNALYAPWSDEMARRQARLEFIRFLLRDRSYALAAAELVAMRDDLPDTVPAHLETGDLFVQARDAAAALDEYTSALRLDPQNEKARIGAGRAAFTLKDYAQARRYLRGGTVSAEDARRLEVADIVLSLDPLATRVPARERVRRMRRLLTEVSMRLEACKAGTAASPGSPGLVETLRAADTSLGKMPAGDAPIEDDMVLAVRAARLAASACGSASTMDEAIVAMSQVHGLEQR